eukprot:545299-Karenia_brevis.AAC.1
MGSEHPWGHFSVLDMPGSPAPRSPLSSLIDPRMLPRLLHLRAGEGLTRPPATRNLGGTPSPRVGIGCWSGPS